MEKGREVGAGEDFGLLLYIHSTSPTSGLEKMVGKVQDTDVNCKLLRSPSLSFSFITVFPRAGTMPAT